MLKGGSIRGLEDGDEETLLAKPLQLDVHDVVESHSFGRWLDKLRLQDLLDEVSCLTGHFRLDGGKGVV